LMSTVWVCVRPLETVSPGQCRCLLFSKKHTVFPVLTVPNNQVIINLNVILCFFSGEVQWLSQDCGPGEFAAVFFPVDLQLQWK